MENSERKLRADLRAAIADYMYSEGCSCCQDTDAHEENTKRLGELLNVKKHSDGSGYDFSKYKTLEASRQRG